MFNYMHKNGSQCLKSKFKLLEFADDLKLKNLLIFINEKK